MDQSQIKSLLTSVTESVNADIKEFTPFNNLCKKFKFQPSHIFMGILLLLLLLTITGVFQHIFVTLFAMLYPAYMSFKAIHSGVEESKKSWLVYWIIFGLLTTLDTPLSYILWFIPGYYALKTILYVWLFYPRTNGARVIYKIIKPILQTLRQQIETIK